MVLNQLPFWQKNNQQDNKKSDAHTYQIFTPDAQLLKSFDKLVIFIYVFNLPHDSCLIRFVRRTLFYIKRPEQPEFKG